MSFSCTDKDTLVAYMYGECDEATRGAVTAHLEACPACADEVNGFGAVREALVQWAPPERAGSFRIVRETEAEAQAPARVLRPARWWRTALPALGRVAAGILLFAGGAALANLEVRYDKDGFAVRTGWQKAAPPAAQVAARPVESSTGPAVRPAAAASEPAPATGAQAGAAPWRADLAALQRQMRDEFRQQVAATQVAAARTAPAPGPVQVAGSLGFDEKRLMQRVYDALEESEVRQQNAFTFRLSSVVNDLQAGRPVRIGFDALPPTLMPQRPKNPNLFDVSLPVKK